MLPAFVSIFATATTLAVVARFATWAGRSLEPSSAPWSSTLPVLGGAEPSTHAWNRFHARFYPMALVLIAFGMEMMFMYPWAVVFVEEGVKAVVEMGVFLAVLSLGVLYAWREGGFRWQ
ncbi:MAG: NADH-quinone oxidoreductase subunit A [Haloechinothrix sp.]